MEETFTISPELDEIETNSQTKEKWGINERKFFGKKKNKIDKPLAKTTKRKTEKTQINKIKDEQDNITIDTREIQKSLKTYFEIIYSML